MGMVTVKGPDATAVTLASGGRAGADSIAVAALAQGSVTDGATTSAMSFSRPSASTVGFRLR